MQGAYRLHIRNATFFLQAVESPDLASASPNSIAKIYVANFIFSCIFFIEMLVKIAVHGLLFQVGDHGTCCWSDCRHLICCRPFIQGSDRSNVPYLHDGYNILDFFVVLVSFVCDLALIASPSSSVSGILFLRALRALRPLRLLSRRQVGNRCYAITD